MKISKLELVCAVLETVDRRIATREMELDQRAMDALIEFVDLLVEANTGTPTEADDGPENL